MKAGRTLKDLAAEIERQAESKEDFIAPAQSVTMTVDDTAMEDFQRLIAKPVKSTRRGRNRRRNAPPPQPQREPTLLDSPVRITGLDGTNDFGIRPLAHGQFAEHLSIPKRYYDRMATTDPELLTLNVNRWLGAESNKRMFRTMDGNVRAFLSDSYKRMDYFDFLSAILPIIKETGMEIISCQVTERKLYLKCVNARMESKVVGDIVQAGAVFSNSEVGCGRMNIQTMVFTLECANGMVGESILGKAHLGRAQGGDDDKVERMLKDTTKEHEDQVLWEKVHDVTESLLKDEELFKATVDKLNTAAGEKIEGDVMGAVVKLKQQTNISDKASNGILRHLIQGGDLSKWGMSSAVTRYSQDVDDYDEATELESLGHKVIEMPKASWEAIKHAEPVKTKAS
jgi:hypothetical protein